MANTLYYGDNLDVMRRHIKDETIDLIYADPPFKSNQNYNVLFQEKDGDRAASQILAFEDTWSWDAEDEAVFADLVQAGGRLSEAMQAVRQLIGPCDMLSYLVMMAPRLMECRRVLKPTGSMYLHCDPSASHYLKLLMDAVFGPGNFRNEVVWKRTSAHSDTKQGVIHMGRIHDNIFFYTKSDEANRNEVYLPYDQTYIDRFYRHVDPDGRRYTTGDLTGPGGASRGNPLYEFMGVTRYWRYSEKNMNELFDQGRIIQAKPGTVPRYKRYLDEMPGVPLQDVWTDLSPIGAQAAERLGYPTQKPIALLERIIQASCPVGGTVLDPFCGCGTTVVAAQKLGRSWIGIDITHLAITLMKERLKGAFGDQAVYEVVGEPVGVTDAAALAASDPLQFQYWALGLVGARPAEQKKGADKGIDGKLLFQSDKEGTFETVILSVKAGHTGVQHVRDLRGVLDREKAAIGVLISMQDPTGPMRQEAATCGVYESTTWGRKHPKMQLLTISELLAGKEIDMPPIKRTFKEAGKMQGKAGEQGGLFI